MRINYFSRIVSIVFFCLLVTSLSAKDIFLSATGSDDNDGLTEATPIATVTKAFRLLENTNDTIRVSGMIDITQDPNWQVNTGLSDDAILSSTRTWNVSIKGTDKETSGFTSGNQSRFCNQIAGYNGASFNIIDLTFKDLGTPSLGGGSALRILNNGSQITIQNCDFTGILGSQGSLFVYNSLITVRNCNFYNNSVTNGNAIFCDNNVNESPRKLLVDNCKIEDNDSSGINGQGGAFYLQQTNDITIRDCIIRNNRVASNGGAFIIRAESSPNNPTVCKINIEDCLIANNFAGDGGAIHVKNSVANYSFHLSIINTTIYGNESNNNGALFFYQAREGSILDIINSTIVENKSIAPGSNAGHGPGLRFLNLDELNSSALNITKRIYNSIIERNMAAGTAGNSGDISFTSQQEDGVNCIIRNSYIGYVLGSELVNNSEYNNYIGYNLGSGAELAWPSIDYINERGCIPLDFESPALAGGNASYLEALGIHTDQEGNLRSFTDGICAIGAVEPSVVAGLIDDPNDYKHYIIYGQSLSTGHDSDPLSTDNIDGNYMIGTQVWSNYGNTDLNTLNPLNASAVGDYLGENPIIGAVNHLRKQIPLVMDGEGKENRFLATSAGTSGKPIEELSKEFEGSNYLYNDYLTALKKGRSMATRRSSNITVPGIVFMQGEWNYQGHGTDLSGTGTPTADKEAYKELLLNLKSNMQKDAREMYEQENSPIFYTYQTGVQYTSGRTLNIGMAQLEAANEKSDIVMVGPVYPMTDVGGHLDANGYRWYGEMIGKVIYKTEVLGETFIPLQPTKVSRVEDNPKQLRIQFYAPQLPLVFDTETLLEMPNYGFNIYLNDADQTITTVEVDGENGDYVVITCENDLTGKIEVTYAGNDATLSGYNLRGHGNLRDSDDTVGFFDYVQRTWTKPTTSGEPKDSEGNIIYDKPYPLYNFSVAFYYQLAADEQSVVVFDPNIEPDPEFELNRESLSLVAGESFRLSMTEAFYDDLTWESEDPAIATVSESGLVEGVKAGTTQITVTDNISGKTAFCEVTVNAPEFTLDLPAATLEIGETIQLNITEAYYDDLTWESEDPGIATVSQSGLVEGIKAGATQITVTDNISGKTAFCEVTVKEPTPEPPFELNQSTVTIKVDETAQLSITEASYDDVSWESENPVIATVSATGLIEGVGVGTTKIIAKDNTSDKTAFCEVTVTEKESISSITTAGFSLKQIDSVLEIESAVNGKLQLNVYNVSGNVVKSYAEETVESGEVKSYDLKPLPGGMYVVKVGMNSDSYAAKIIIK